MSEPIQANEKIHPKHILLSIVAFLCLVALYVATVCFMWSRYHDFKWQTTLESNSYFSDVDRLFRSGEFDEYSRWMQILTQMQATWDIKSPGTTSPSTKKNGREIRDAKVIQGEEYQEKIKDDRRYYRKRSMERSKSQEMVFQFGSIFLLVIAHAVFILPFFYKLQVGFRIRLFMISLIYGGLGLICFLAGVMESHSVFETNSYYRDYEDLALNGSKAAILLSSCGLRETEFTRMVEHTGLKEMRRSFHVCQDVELKLIASFIFVGVGMVYIVFFAVFLRDYCYAMKNKIIPAREILHTELAIRNARMIESHDIAAAEIEQERLNLKSEAVAVAPEADDAEPGQDHLKTTTPRNTNPETPKKHLFLQTNQKVLKKMG
ncbi:unnamed protein product [Allacma fusca]|uniref:Uncharacterized protein n=1 Tax=Allacma fusca TaxID=39272 RepID=A0A8J2L3S3_9HEXA|nr:unnamed protein product [Allacma fusca]